MTEQSGRLDLIQRAAKRLGAMEAAIAVAQPAPKIDGLPEHIDRKSVV